MKIESINCPYCETEQKIFYFNYNVTQFLKKVSNDEKIVPLRFYINPHKFIKNFNCKNCKEILTIFYNSETYQYFVQGEKLVQIQKEIRKIKLKIKKLRKKIIVTYNQKIIDMLNSEIDNETKSLDHFIQQDLKVRNTHPLQLNQVVNF